MQDGDGREKLNEKKKALIISVSEYKNLRPLDFCKKDGNEMYKLLNEELEYEIVADNRLIGQIEGGKMADTIIRFFRDPSVNSKDTLLFYYSGHGIPDITGDVYLASSEINSIMPSLRGFSFDQLTKTMQASNSTRIVTILDCCYAGAASLPKGEDNAVRARAAIDEKSEILKQGQGKCLLASSLGTEAAYPLSEEGFSLFTYYLLKGLRGNATSLDIRGYVTPISLGSYLYDAIVNLPQDKKQEQQTPVTKMQGGGDIILAYYPDKVVDPMRSARELSNVAEENEQDSPITFSEENWEQLLESIKHVILTPVVGESLLWYPPAQKGNRK